MTDALDLLTRRNPVDEAALPARDARAAEDLARIMQEPAPLARPRRRSTSPGMRLTLGAAGVAGIAALMGGLFLLRPETEPRGTTGALARGEWALEAMVRVEPSPGGLGLEEATRRAAEIVRARAVALRRQGVAAEPTAPGLVRVRVPWGTVPADAERYTFSTDITLVDLRTQLVADTLRSPASVVRWLDGTARPGPPGQDWVALTRRGEVVSGPRPAPERFFGGVRWLRPPAGVHLVYVPRVALGLPPARPNERATSFYGVIVDPPLVTADDVLATGRDGSRLRLTLRDPVRVTGRDTYLRVHGVLVGRVLPTPGPSREIVVARAGRDQIGPGAEAVSTAGGGLDAALTVESTRVLGTPPPRTGSPSAIVPELRRRFARSPIFVLPRVTPRWSTALDVLSTRTGAGHWRITEVLTNDPSKPLGFLSGPHGGQTWACVLGPIASIINPCERTAAHVIGRASPKVASIEVRYRSGAVRTAVVQNGWFLLLAGRGDGAIIVALDEDGKVLREISR